MLCLFIVFVLLASQTSTWCPVEMADNLPANVTGHYCEIVSSIINNSNTQIAAVALPPSTTHPLPWAEQHTQEHTLELAPKCILHVFTCTFTDLPRLSNLPLLCPSTPVTPPRSPTAVIKITISQPPELCQTII